jgi:hypothetical protein
MERNNTTPSLSEVASVLGSWMVGGGILTMMLFPFMVPILLLTVAFALPLLAPLLVLAILAAPVLIVRAAIRAVRRARGRRSQASPAGLQQPGAQNEPVTASDQVTAY